MEFIVNFWNHLDTFNWIWLTVMIVLGLVISSFFWSMAEDLGLFLAGTVAAVATVATLFPVGILVVDLFRIVAFLFSDFVSLLQPLFSLIGPDMLLFGIPLLLIAFFALLVVDCFLFHFEVERWGGVIFAVTLLLGVFLLAGSLTGLNDLAQAHGGWLTFLVKIAIVWVAAGAATALLKWLQLSNRVKRFVKEHRESYDGSKIDFFTKSLPQISGWARVSKGVMKFVKDGEDVTFKLNTNNFRNIMMDWLTYWPIHFAVLLFADLFRIVYDFLIDLSQSFFRRITLVVLGGAFKD